MYDIYTGAPGELALFVYGRDLRLRGVIEQFGTLVMERSLYGIGNWELHTVAGAKGLELLTCGNLVSLGKSDSRVGIVGQRVVDNGRGKHDVTITGRMLKGLAARRIVVPPTKTQDPTALGMEAIKGTAEEVLRHYINLSMVSPRDAGRKLPGLVLDDLHNPPRGPTAPWLAVHEDTLEETLEGIGAWTKVGWDIRLDIRSRRLVAVVVPPRDFARGNEEGNPPVIFSRDIGNLGDYKYADAGTDWDNTLYLGGAGAYEDQLVLSRSIDAQGQPLGQHLTGWDRNEAWLSVGNIADPVKLLDEGLHKHNEQRQPPVTLEAEILDMSVYPYGDRWDLGDRVTVYAHPAGQAVRLDAQITGVREVYERGRRGLEVTFGSKAPSPKDKFRRLERSMTKL